MVAEEKSVSTFALIVDKLRMMDEAELKLAYVKLFKEEIIADFKALFDEANFGDISDEELTRKVYERRYQTEPQA